MLALCVSSFYGPLVKAAEKPYDLVLRNARIVDGTGSPWYRADLAIRGDTIARIAPALRRAFPEIPPPVELPAELARRYVWNSFSEFVGRAAQRQPLLLVLEDLHWAGESTLLLTEYLAPLLPEWARQ